MNNISKLIVFFTLLLIFQFAMPFSSVNGQVVQSLKLKLANDYFEKFHYSEAIPLYEELLHKNPENEEAKKKLATSYRLSNDTRNSERLYAQLTAKENAGLLDKLYYAQALAENGKYDKANIWYTKYDGAFSIDIRAKRFINAYKEIDNFYADSSKWEIEFLSINSPQADFSPMYYKKGLAFCSSRGQASLIKQVYGWDKSAFLDLYYIEDLDKIHGEKFKTSLKEDVVLNYYDESGHVINAHAEDSKNSSNDSHTLGYYGNTYLKENEAWIEESKHLVIPFDKKINSKYHEGPMAYANENDSVVFTRNNLKKHGLNRSKDGISKLKIYSAKNNAGVWSEPKPLKFNNFKYYVKFTGLNNSSKTGADTSYLKDIVLDDNQFSVSHPAFSKDHKKFFFVSDAPIGYGGTDIYVCTWENGKWSDPINCGKNVNTEGNEVFPYVDENGSLYFASDTWGGIGGLDIFCSKIDSNITAKFGNNFKKPFNLGFPINSKKDDFGIIVNKDFTSGFFSSNRKMVPETMTSIALILLEKIQFA